MTVRREVAWILGFDDELIVTAAAYGSWDEALEPVGLPE